MGKCCIFIVPTYRPDDLLQTPRDTILYIRHREVAPGGVRRCPNKRWSEKEKIMAQNNRATDHLLLMCLKKSSGVTGVRDLGPKRPFLGVLQKVENFNFDSQN